MSNLPSFKEYLSKPIKRLAYQIKESDHIECLPDKVHLITIDCIEVSFVAHEPVKAGDYIVYLNDMDIYHCNAQVFKDRNII